MTICHDFAGVDETFVERQGPSTMDDDDDRSSTPANSRKERNV